MIVVLSNSRVTLQPSPHVRERGPSWELHQPWLEASNILKTSPTSHLLHGATYQTPESSSSRKSSDGCDLVTGSTSQTLRCHSRTTSWRSQRRWVGSILMMRIEMEEVLNSYHSDAVIRSSIECAVHYSLSQHIVIDFSLCYGCLCQVPCLPAQGKW